MLLSELIIEYEHVSINLPDNVSLLNQENYDLLRQICEKVALLCSEAVV